MVACGVQERSGKILPVRTLRATTLHAVLFAAAACGGSPTTPAQPTIYDTGTPGLTLPTVIREVRPSYTAAAIAAGIQGTVLVSVVVLTDGTVGDVTVTRSLDTIYGLDAQAISAARQWLFNPGMKDGRPVAVRVTIEFTFTLR
jgi:TonB family protein